MRGIVQFTMAALCIALVGAGLYMSLDTANKNIVLDAPGTPGRLVSDGSTATAFFEMEGDRLELTMLFSSEDDPQSVFRTRVRLAEGQSHSIVVADDEGQAGSQRFVFRRVGDTVAMSLAPYSETTTTFVAGE